MPYYNKRLDSWTGQVKKTFTVENSNFLKGQKNWTQKKNDEEKWLFKKEKNYFEDARAATVWESDELEEVLIFLNNPLSNSWTFKNVALIYLDEVELKSTGPNTFNDKKRVIKELLSHWMADKTLPIKKDDIDPYLKEVFLCPGKGGKTANRRLRELKTLFNWMIKNKKYNITENPCKHISNFPAKSFKKYVPPREDIFSIMGIGNPMEQDLTTFMYHTLARSGEVRRLKKEHCHFQIGMVTLYTRKRKDGALEGDNIPLNKVSSEILRRRCDTVDDEYIFPGVYGGKMPRPTMDKMMPRLCKQVNDLIIASNRREKNEKDYLPAMKNFSFHAIRHYVTSYLYMECGYMVGELQRLLRHKNATTTDGYLKSICDMEFTRGLEILT